MESVIGLVGVSKEMEVFPRFITCPYNKMWIKGVGYNTDFRVPRITMRFFEDYSIFLRMNHPEVRAIRNILQHEYEYAYPGEDPKYEYDWIRMSDITDWLAPAHEVRRFARLMGKHHLI